MSPAQIKATLRVGMSDSDVSAALGKPTDILTKGESEVYDYHGQGLGETLVISFKNGKVKGGFYSGGLDPSTKSLNTSNDFAIR